MNQQREYPEDGADFTVLESSDEILDIDPSADCNGKLKKEDRGNSQYAWWYVINNSDKEMTATIKRTWVYGNESRSDTKRISLFPGEEKLVFDFDRAQDPKINPTRCSLS